MPDGREYVKLWLSYETYFEPLADAEVGRLVRAMMKYKSDGTEPKFSGNERFTWPSIKRDMDEAERAYIEYRDSRSQNGSKGGRPKKAYGFSENQKKHMVFEETIESIDNQGKRNKEQGQRAKENIDTDDDTARASAPDLGTVMRKYMELIQDVPPSFVTDFLKSYTDDLGAEAVCYAIEKAASENVHKWSYVQSILQDYTKKGIRTLAAAQRDAEEFQQAKDKTGAARRSAPKQRGSDRMGFLADSIRRDLENDRAGREGDNLPFGDAVGQLQGPGDGS